MYSHRTYTDKEIRHLKRTKIISLAGFMTPSNLYILPWLCHPAPSMHTLVPDLSANVQVPPS